MKFNQDGSIDLANSTLFGAAGAPANIALAASGTGTTPRWSNGLGIAAQNLTFDLVATDPVGLDLDGQLGDVRTARGAGNIVGVQVGTDGVVSALFDNSQVRKIAQVAVATFPNSDGLKATSGNAYQATLDAGQMTLKTAGQRRGGQDLGLQPRSLDSRLVV